jgi:hypothetical protein
MGIAGLIVAYYFKHKFMEKDKNYRFILRGLLYFDVTLQLNK